MTSPDSTHHPHHATLVNDDGSWKHTNALIDETSPYLLQHAHNPVDWLPWGETAFDAARQRGVPLFLSIGYATCYWCHVMEREVFEDPAIAEQMNRLFVCVKVDREQRPDIDDLYMTATQVMTQRGGWPMSVFLTPPGAKGADDPGLRPFWCGTYIPPRPMHGMAGFPQVLDSLSGAWQKQRDEVQAQGDQVAGIVAKHLGEAAAPEPIDAQAIDRAVQAISSTYDAEHGGYGDAPKFPTPSVLMLLAAFQRRENSTSLREQIDHTLDRMARGGLFDQVGGGFHRYSVDERWLVPHFEKMLYDNGQLLELYSGAYAEADNNLQKESLARIVRATCAYVLREMTDPTGAFWSAQDAEVAGREGENYLWTPAQIDDAIEDAELAGLAKSLYGLDQGPNFRDPHAADAPPANVLFMPQPLADTAAAHGLSTEAARSKQDEINRQLLATRDQRPAPATDDKVLTAWNGMMIAGLAEAGAALDEPRFIDAAARAADAVLEHLAIPQDAGPEIQRGGLYRSYRQGDAAIPGFLDDYAHFVHGLLALQRARPDDPTYLDKAERLTAIAIDRFAHPAGGYYDTRADQRDLFVRTRSAYDGATPSGNSQMIHNLIDLAASTGNNDYARRAGRDLQSFAHALTQHGTGMTHMLHALMRLVEQDPASLELTENATANATPQATSHSPSGVSASIEPQPARTDDDTAAFTVVLDIPDGLHLTAGGIDAPGATTLELDHPQDMTLHVDWPAGEHMTSPIADQPLAVYTGQVHVPVTVRCKENPPDTLTLRLGYQPCTDHACHRPETLRLQSRITKP